MAFDVGTLVLNYRVNMRQLNRDLTQAQKAVLQNLDEIEKVGKRLAVGVTAPLVAFGGLATKLAADAAEAASKTEAVFGRLTGDVNAWVEDLRQTVPATTKQLQGFASSIQDLLVPMGVAEDAALGLTKQVVALAADLASFNNLRIDDVLRDIQSGLVGQNEPLLKYGVAIDAALVKQRALELGLVQQGQALSANARAQAAFSLILERTTAAQGDAARTADSAANSFKFLLAEVQELAVVLGQQLLPIVTPVVKGLTSLVRSFAELPAPVRAVSIGLAAFVAGIGPALIAFTKLQAKAVAFRALFLGGSTTGLLSLLGPQGLVVAGVAALAVGVGALALKFRQANDDAVRFRDTLQGMSADNLRVQTELVAVQLDRARATMEQLTQQNRSAGGASEAITVAMIEQQGVIISLEQRLKDLQAQSEATSSAASSSIAPTPPADVDKDLDPVTEALRRMEEQLRAVERAAVLYGDSFDAAGAKVAILASALEDLDAAGLRQSSERMQEIQAQIRALTLTSKDLTFEAMQEGLRISVLTAEELRQKLLEAGAAGASSTVPMVAADTVGLEQANREVVNLADNFGAVAGAISEVDRQAGDFFGRLSGIVSAITTGGFAGITAAIGIGVGLLKSIFGGDEEGKRRALALQNSVDRLTSGIARLGRDVLNLEGSLVSGVTKALEQASRVASSVSGPNFFENTVASAALQASLAELGLTMQDLERVARSLGIEGFEATKEGIDLLLQAVRSDFLRQAFNDFGVQMDLLRAKLQVAGATDVEKFTALLDKITGAVGGTLKADLGTINLQNAEAVIAALLDKLPTLTAEDFGKLNPDDLIRLLVELDTLADAASGAASALQEATNILNAPAGFKFALASFNASEADQIIPLQASIPGGGTSITIEGDLNVNASDPEELGRKVDQSARRRSSRGGRTAIDNTTNGVRY